MSKRSYTEKKKVWYLHNFFSEIDCKLYKQLQRNGKLYIKREILQYFLVKHQTLQ